MNGLRAVVARSSHPEVLIVGISKILTVHIRSTSEFDHRVAFAISRQQAEAMGVPDLGASGEVEVELFVRPRGAGVAGLGIGEEDPS